MDIENNSKVLDNPLKQQICKACWSVVSVGKAFGKIIKIKNGEH